jgi:hypothetical protein
MRRFVPKNRKRLTGFTYAGWMAPEHWWKERPGWVDALYLATPDSKGDGRFGLEWLSEAASRSLAKDVRKRLREDGAGYGLDPAVVEPMLASPFLPLAHLPTRSDRRGMVPYRPTLFADLSRPEQAYLGFDALTPPLYWLGAGTSRESLERAWAPYSPERLPSRLELRRERRFFVGSARELGELSALSDALVMRPGIDSLRWGTAYDDDPWRERVEGHLLAIMSMSRDVERQRPSALEALSCRTVFTGSLVTLTTFEGFYALSLRYAPVDHASVYGPLNERFGVRFPTDVPLDAFMALAAFSGFATADDMETTLKDPGERAHHIGDAVIYALLCHDDLRRLSWVVREPLAVPAAEGKELRRVAAQLAYRFELQAELCAMLETETDPELSAMLLDMTRLGGDP